MGRKVSEIAREIANAWQCQNKESKAPYSYLQELFEIYSLTEPASIGTVEDNKQIIIQFLSVSQIVRDRNGVVKRCKNELRELVGLPVVK